jgi:hypothetical protein
MHAMQNALQMLKQLENLITASQSNIDCKASRC